MSGQSDTEKALDYAIAARNFEIGLLWQRSLFFWGFVVAIGAGYTQVEHPIEKFVFCVAGSVVSIGWVCVNYGSKWWQSKWEEKVREISEVGRMFADESPLKSETTNNIRFSVSEILIYISYFISLCWIMVALSSFRDILLVDSNSKELKGSIIIIVIFVILFVSRMISQSRR